MGRPGLPVRGRADPPGRPDETALREALDAFTAFGASAAARLTRQRLRTLGVRAISAETVDHHVSAVLAKLGAPNRNAAAAQAAKVGLIT